MAWIQKAKENPERYPKPYGNYLETKEPLAKRIVEMIDALGEATWKTEKQRELSEIAVEALGRLLEEAYPEVVQKAEILAEFERRARQRAKEEGVPIAVAKGRILIEDKELYRKLRGHV